MLTNALVVRTESYTAGTSFVFEHYINNVRYENSTMYGSICVSAIRKIKGREFPIIYEKGNPKNSRVLLTEKQFKKVNLIFPDSLQWISETCN